MIKQISKAWRWIRFGWPQPSGNETNANSIYNLGTFLVATGLIATVLLVWAQLWPIPYLDTNKDVSNLGVGLLWTYSALAFALLAFAWAFFYSFQTRKDLTPTTAIGLFVAAIIMTIANVGQSVFTTFCKVLSDRQIFEPLPLHDWFQTFIICWILVVLVFSILIVHKHIDRVILGIFIILSISGVAGVVAVLQALS